MSQGRGEPTGMLVQRTRRFGDLSGLFMRAYDVAPWNGILGGIFLLVACGSGVSPHAIAEPPEYVDSAMGQPLPSRAEIRRDADRGTIRWLRAPNLSARLEQDPEFRTLQLANKIGEVALAFLMPYREPFQLTIRLPSSKCNRLCLNWCVSYSPVH